MTIQRIVLDTNVLVSALLSPEGNPARIYKKFLTGSLESVINADIFAEYLDVPSKPRLQIPVNEMKTVLFAVWQYSEYREPIRSTIALPDEDDRIFYDTAKTAGAFLITGNTKHYPQESFVLTPTEFLTKLI